MCAQVRAGVRQKVAAALEQTEALEAKIDVKQAEYNKAIAAINEDKSVLQQKLADTQIASHSISMQLQAAAEKAARHEQLPVDEHLPVNDVICFWSWRLMAMLQPLALFKSLNTGVHQHAETFVQMLDPHLHGYLQEAVVL